MHTSNFETHHLRANMSLFHGKLELFPKWLHFNYMYVYNLTSLFSCRQWEEVRKKQQATALFFPVSQSKIHSLPVF